MRFSVELCARLAARTCADELPPGHVFDAGAAAACARAEGQRYQG